MTPDLYLHDLRQRLETRRGRALPVPMSTLARRLGALRAAPDDPAVMRRLEQAGITMRVPAGGRLSPTTRMQLALSQGGGAAGGPSGCADPLGRAVSATVVVRADEESGGAFIVDEAGLLVTAFHVVAGERGLLPRRVGVVFADGRQARVDLFAGHAVLDFALGWLEPGSWPAVPLGTPADLQYGQIVFAVGSPASPAPEPDDQPTIFRWTLSRGIVSHPCRAQDGIDWIQTDAAIDHGSSGGPLLDEAGHVVGISSRCYEGVRASGLALPIDYLASDIAHARDAGRRACLAGRTCRACGRWHEPGRVAHCRTCGAIVGR